MNKLTIGLLGMLAYTSLTAVYAATGHQGDRIENRFDRQGDRVESRFDRQADRARYNGRDGMANRLERRGDNINARFDRRGDRANRRVNRHN